MQLSLDAAADDDDCVFYQTVWLLSGSDHRIHVYHSDEVSYQEEDGDSQSFPEFSNLTQIILWMDILYSSDKKRYILMPCVMFQTDKLTHYKYQFILRCDPASVASAGVSHSFGLIILSFHMWGRGFDLL